MSFGFDFSNFENVDCSYSQNYAPAAEYVESANNEYGNIFDGYFDSNSQENISDLSCEEELLSTFNEIDKDSETKEEKTLYETLYPNNETDKSGGLLEYLTNETLNITQPENIANMSPEAILREEIAKEYNIDVNNSDGMKAAITDIIEANPGLFTEQELYIITQGDNELIELANKLDPTYIDEETSSRFANATGKDPNSVPSEAIPVFKTLTSNGFSDEDTAAYLYNKDGLDSKTREEMQETLNTSSHSNAEKDAGIGSGKWWKGVIQDSLDGESKDGKISNTSQGDTGDCWLLSGINALSYTEEGRKMIEDSLIYNKDEGYTLVDLKGYGKVRVDDSELTLEKGSNSKYGIDSSYSTGDDDMMIFEIAVKKAYEDVANENVFIYRENNLIGVNSSEINSKLENHEIAIEGGETSDLIYLVTGKTSDTTYNKEEMTEMLDKFEENGNQNIALSANTDERPNPEPIKVTDINNKEVELPTNHAYSIKEVKDGVISVINPHNSAEVIKLDYNTFTENFSSLHSTDLSENNPSINYTTRQYKTDENNNKTWHYENNKKGFEQNYVNSKGEVVDIYSQDITTDKHGNIIKTEYYGKNHEPLFCVDYNNDWYPTPCSIYDAQTGKSSEINDSITNLANKVTVNGVNNVYMFKAPNDSIVERPNDRKKGKCVA